jgi:hypothetical protein
MRATVSRSDAHARTGLQSNTYPAGRVANGLTRPSVISKRPALDFSFQQIPTHSMSAASRGLARYFDMKFGVKLYNSVWNGIQMEFEW